MASLGGDGPLPGAPFAGLSPASGQPANNLAATNGTYGDYFGGGPYGPAIGGDNPTPSPAPNAPFTKNWSGYVAATSLSAPQADSVTAVSGSWVVPAVSGTSGGSTYSAVWVGLDGCFDKTVEQIGTEQDVVNGTPVYRAWWEMSSSGLRQPEQPISSMTIQPGDSISASVTYTTSGQFELTIGDNSRANDSFSISVSSAQFQSPLAQRSSAEWTVETPTVGNGVAALADFGSVGFTNASAVINGVSGPIDDPSWQSQAINIGTARGTLEDTTSVLVDSNSTSSFVVTDDSTAGVDGWGAPVAASDARGATFKATVPSGTSATVPFPGIVADGVAPVPPLKRPASGVSGDLSSS
jgi:hypothetical protein